MRLIAAAMCHLLVWCCVATALPSTNSATLEAAKPLPTPARESPTPRVEESQPSIYYLPDKQGNLQPVLDFKYQEFVDLYKLKNQLGGSDRPPRYSLPAAMIRSRNCCVLASRGRLNMSAGAPCSRITPSSRKQTRFATSRANPIS